MWFNGGYQRIDQFEYNLTSLNWSHLKKICKLSIINLYKYKIGTYLNFNADIFFMNDKRAHIPKSIYI